MSDIFDDEPDSIYKQMIRTPAIGVSRSFSKSLIEPSVSFIKVLTPISAFQKIVSGGENIEGAT